jgi:rod shape-determining protein MreD
MRNAATLVLGFALLLVQAAVATILPLHPFTPNPLLPIVIYLGVHQDVSLLRGAFLSFFLGYLLDEFCGSPMGLLTFVTVATFMLARGAGLRLFLRGPLFQVGLTFAIGLLSGGTILALRTIFEPPEAFSLAMPTEGVMGTVIGFLTGTGESDAPLIGSYVSTAISLVASALASALISPLVFAALWRIDAVTVRGRGRGGEEPAAP